MWPSTRLPALLPAQPGCLMCRVVHNKLRVQLVMDAMARADLHPLFDAMADDVSWRWGVDVQSAYAAAVPSLATAKTPPLVSALLVSGLGVPGALVEVSAVAAVI